MLAGLVASPSLAGITLRAGRLPEAQGIEVTTYLSDRNEALDKALLIHNVMNEMPGLRDMARTTATLKKQSSLLKEMQKNIESCSVKKLGKVFKDPQKVWSKMSSTYEKRRQSSQKEIEDQKKDRLTLSLQERQQIEMMGWNINRDIMMDVYANPKKWGDVNKGGAFPLWKDQISLFEKEWNAFYEKLNVAYGVPLKGRPAVDEDTRHNLEKYDEVLAAHKVYLKQISSGRKPTNPDIAKALPPKAPKALPRWQEIVRVDPVTGKPIPELPEPWKKMSDNEFKNYADGGEMAEAFDGKSMTPTKKVSEKAKGDLELGYEMELAVDSTEKGAEGNLGTQQKMVQPFVEKLAKLGIDTKDFDISNQKQYAEVQKQLKELKKAAMKEAYQYTEKLEEQDRKDPDYVAQREKLKAKKRARLSADAQAATAEVSDSVQISQMSPAVQQRLVLSALEKDEGASVYLTQTNAVNVEQLMREQKSTDKIIAESYQQMNSSMEKQRELMPQTAECHF